MLHNSHRNPLVDVIKDSNRALGKVPEYSFDHLPDEGYVREAQLVQSARLPSAPIPFSAPTLWRKVKAGTFPKPVKLSERVTAWRVADVREWMKVQLQ
jgi:prophage regulatory protein